MRYMTKEEYIEKFKNLHARNVQIMRRRKLREERFKLFPKIKWPSTSKLVLWGVFLICIEMLAFSQYAMIALGDASAMYVLLGIPAALIPTCLGYFSKAKAENTIGGITYETVIRQNKTDCPEEAVG